MKDIKTFVIGFLSCACMFLIMGQTKTLTVDEYKNLQTQEQIGRYQGFGYATKLSYSTYLVDTVNGTLYERAGNVWHKKIDNK